MKREHITKGTQIDTLDGFIVLKERNDGGLFYADEYTINDDGNPELSGVTKLTKSEIERTMKEIDGRNHSVIWEEPYES